MQMFKFSCLFAAAAILSIGSVSAQKRDTKITDIDVSVLPSPQIDAGISKKFKPKDWIEIEVKIEHSPRQEPQSGYEDDVQVRWHILVENPNTKNGPKFLKLSQTVQHQNLPVGEEVFASIYLSPATIRKISGKDGANDSLIHSMAAEVFINGTPAGSVLGGTLKKKNWWNVSDRNIGNNDNFKLLTKADTPFAPLWWDRYLEVKADRR